MALPVHSPPLLPCKAADIPIVACHVISPSTTLLPFQTCWERNQTSTHDEKRHHQRRPDRLLIQVLFFAEPTRPCKAHACPCGGKTGPPLSPGCSKGQAEEELSGQKRPGLWGTPASRSQYGEATSIGFALSRGLQSPSRSPAARARELFPSLDQIRDHDLLIVINIA